MKWSVSIQLRSDQRIPTVLKKRVEIQTEYVSLSDIEKSLDSSLKSFIHDINNLETLEEENIHFNLDESSIQELEEK